MKGKIVTLVLLFLASLLFPYTMTILCFDTGLMSYQPEDLYSVVLENEKTVSAEQYLVGILAQEIDPSMEQETLKAGYFSKNVAVSCYGDKNFCLRE